MDPSLDNHHQAPSATASARNGEYYHELFENVPLMYFALDQDGRVLEVNTYGAEQLGYTREELLGGDVLEVFHPADRAAVENQLRALITSPGHVARWEFRKIRKDGSGLWVHETARAVASGGEITVMVVCEDISARKEAELRLERYRDQLRSLTFELALAEEAERRRIATGLHDEVGQKLALAKLHLSEIDPARCRESHDRLERVFHFLDEAIGETRSLTLELASPVLYELGIQAALQDLGERLSKTHGFRFEFEANGEPRQLYERTQVVLYRMVRELLFNVVKHARASKVRVEVGWKEREIFVVLTDDGVGFDLARLDEDPRQGHSFGLFKTRERLELLGGSLDIESAPGAGTRITLHAPVN